MMKPPGIMCPVWFIVKHTAGKEFLTKVSNLSLIEPLAIASRLFQEIQGIEAQVKRHHVETNKTGHRELHSCFISLEKSVLGRENR